MSDYDLCTFLGNLLDNGLEHSVCGRDGYLYLDIFSSTAGEVLVRMENSCQQRPVVKHGRLLTQREILSVMARECSRYKLSQNSMAVSLLGFTMRRNKDFLLNVDSPLYLNSLDCKNVV